MRLLPNFLALTFIAFSAWGQVPAGVPVREGLPTLAPILEKVTPAVVNIAVLQRSPEEQNPLMRDPFFRRFFGGPQQSEPQIAARSTRSTAPCASGGVGSGCVSQRMSPLPWKVRARIVTRARRGAAS